MKKAIFFDWIGTLSDDRMPVYKANARILAAYRIEQVTMEEFLRNPASNPIEFCRQFKVPIDEETARRTFERYFAEESERTQPVPYDGLIETLELLQRRGTAVGVVSSHPSDKIREEARKYDVNDFIAIVSGTSTDKAKSLRNACCEMGFMPEDVAYVGDMVNDIRQAREARVMPVGICHGYHTRDMLEAELNGSGIIVADLLHLRNEITRNLAGL